MLISYNPNHAVRKRLFNNRAVIGSFGFINHKKLIDDFGLVYMRRLAEHFSVLGSDRDIVLLLLNTDDAASTKQTRVADRQPFFVCGE